MVARTSRKLGKAHGPQFPPNGRLVQRDAEFLEDPTHEVLAPPAHHAVDRRDRSAINHFGQSPALCHVQLRLIAGRLAVDQSARSTSVEAQNPIADDLQRHPADPSGICARAAVVNLGQRQKTSSLGGIFCRLRQPPKGRSVKIRAKGNGLRHGKPPFATEIQTSPALGIPGHVPGAGVARR